MAYKTGKGRGSIHGWGRKREDIPPLFFGARLGYWALLVATAVVIFASTAHAAPPAVEPFVMYQHQSDIMRGPPFFPGGTYEPTNDYLAFGATLSWPRWDLDLSHGAKSIDCAYLIAHTPCKWQSGSQVAVRYYLRRGRK